MRLRRIYERKHGGISILRDLRVLRGFSSVPFCEHSYDFKLAGPRTSADDPGNP